MTTVKDLGVTEDNIRKYTLQNVDDALTDEQLKAICYDYLNQVMRDKKDKWPKDLRSELSAHGICQDHETGLPVVAESAWSLKMACERTIHSATEILDGVKDIVDKNDIFTIVDGLPLKDLTEEQQDDKDLEVNVLLKKISFIQSCRIAGDAYIDKLVSFIELNGLSAPNILGDGMVDHACGKSDKND